MAYEIVQCEVRWIASVGYSGTELPPSKYEKLGEFETEGDACRALAEAGLTRRASGWYGSYSYGYVERTKVEIKT
jgi:sugar phosphate isomerase/epimerase